MIKLNFNFKGGNYSKHWINVDIDWAGELS
jgi:hypothetical protein